MSTLANLTKQERGRLLHCLGLWSDVQRVANGQCRHCGGAVPCWSTFGDVAIGVRRSDSEEQEGEDR